SPPAPRRGAAAISGSSSRRWNCGCQESSLELQAALACAVSQRRDTAVVAVAAPVEDHSGDPGGLRTLGEQLARQVRLLGLPALFAADGGIQRGGGRQGHTLGVVHDLRDDVLEGAGDDQARTLRRTPNLLADPQVAARPGGRARGSALAGKRRPLRHAYLPAFPALRRILSPW